MSGIFVSDKDTFTVSVYYSLDGAKLLVRPGSISETEKQSGKFKQVTLTCKMPSWFDAQLLVRSCTQVSNGRPVVNFSELHGQLLRGLATGWDMKDEDGTTDLPYSLEQLGKLRPQIARGLVDAVLQKLIEDGVYESIVVS